jgi:hypothetical protein
MRVIACGLVEGMQKDLDLGFACLEFVDFRRIAIGISGYIFLQNRSFMSTFYLIHAIQIFQGRF